MNKPFRRIPAIVLLCLLAFSASGKAQPPPAPAHESTPASALAKCLKKRGYAEVPLTLNKTGLLDVKEEVEGISALLVVDTGCNNVNLDRSIAQRAKLEVKEIGKKTAALGDTVATGQAKIAKLAVGELSSPGETFVVDFAHINALRKDHGDPPCEGLLGGSFLMYYSAVIDYAHLKLYLLEPDKRAKNLAKPLEKAGFMEVPLEFNKCGQFDVKVEVNGNAMLLCIDTGTTANGSLDNLAAQRAKLDIKKGDTKFFGAGGSQLSQTAKIERFTIRPLTGPLDVWVQDYSANNRSRKADGAPDCDGMLGGAFFAKHSAIIDYGRRKLYMFDLATK